jgi:hypothetical protein
MHDAILFFDSANADRSEYKSSGDGPSLVETQGVP